MNEYDNVPLNIESLFEISLNRITLYLNNDT